MSYLCGLYRQRQFQLEILAQLLHSACHIPAGVVGVDGVLIHHSVLAALHLGDHTDPGHLAVPLRVLIGKTGGAGSALLVGRHLGGLLENLVLPLILVGVHISVHALLQDLRQLPAGQLDVIHVAFPAAGALVDAVGQVIVPIVRLRVLRAGHHGQGDLLVVLGGHLHSLQVDVPLQLRQLQVGAVVSGVVPFLLVALVPVKFRRDLLLGLSGVIGGGNGLIAQVQVRQLFRQVALLLPVLGGCPLFRHLGTVAFR